MAFAKTGLTNGLKNFSLNTYAERINYQLPNQSISFSCPAFQPWQSIAHVYVLKKF